MRTKIVAFAMVALALFCACNHTPKNASKGRLVLPSAKTLKGDRSVYGLACDGCTDSVVVLLPEDGSDPITYNVIQARHHNKVLGDIRIGDRICLLPNKKDSKVADIVVDLDDMEGIWCYIVFPKLRAALSQSDAVQRQMIRDLPDSIKEQYFIPREYGFWLKPHWQSASVGFVSEQSSLEKQSPVVYPQLGWFTEWHTWNCKFVMTSGTRKLRRNGNYAVTNLQYDTCDIVFLGPDSLVLSDADGSRSYYKKKSIFDVNAKARKIAAEQAKAAQEEIKNDD